MPSSHTAKGFTLDSTAFSSLLSALFSRSGLLRVIAVVMAAVAAGGAMTTAPKMASPGGVPLNDFLNTVIPGVGAVVAWLWSNWAKVSPEMVAAVVALARNPGDATAWLRVTAGLAIFLREVKPDSKALGTLVQFSRELHDELLEGEPRDVNGPVVVQGKSPERMPERMPG